MVNLMANEKNTKTAGAPASNPGPTSGGPTSKSLLGDYLPEGMNEKDIVVTGQLPPMYLGKDHLERAKALNLPIEQIPALVGLINKVEVLPVQERKNSDDFCPFSLSIADMRAPCLGFRGNSEKRVEVQVEKGGTMLFPITGQKTVDRELHAAIRDVEHVYIFAARPIGTEKVNDQPSPMVKWHTEVSKVKKPNGEYLKRSELGAQFMLDPQYVLLVANGDMINSIKDKEHVGLLKTHYKDGIDVTPSGHVHNRATGEVLGKLGPNGQLVADKQIAPGTAQQAAQPS